MANPASTEPGQSKPPRRGRRAAVVGTALAVLAAVWCAVPVPRFSPPYAAVVFDRGGDLLSTTLAADHQWRFPPGEGPLPEKYVRAVLRYEDHRFFRHPGIDPIAVVRALWQNLRRGHVVSGASTLTMQVARLSRPPGARSLENKLLEAAMALRLEAALGKDDIFRLYAANAPFGGNVVGLEAAAWRYFGRSPANLSWAEAAMLAVLPNQPALIHPGSGGRVLREKRDRLLDALFAEGSLDALTCRLAKAEPLPDGPLAFPRLAPHLLTTLETGNATSGNRWETFIDGGLQRRAAAVVERHHRALAQNGIRNLAALILDVPTGRVLAYVGNVADADGASMSDGNQVDVITAPRSTGSILKPFLHATLLDAGDILPGQLVPDVPTRIGGFQPQNYTRTYQGAVPAAMALARSLNVPAVHMLQACGVARFHRQLSRLGMTTLFRPAGDYGLSLILGGAEGRLWDITGMYAGLARAAGGQPAFFPPRVVRTGQEGNAVPARPDDRAAADQPLLGPAAAWLTIDAMLNVSRPDEDAQWRRFSSSRRVAWKTGTSFGYRDGWAVGVTPEVAVGVWVGNADGEGRPGLTGIGTAAPVMFDLFGLLAKGEWFSRPAGMVDIEVCADSGFRAGPSCLHRRTQWVPLSGLRAGPCPYCRSVAVDGDGRWQVHAGCTPMSRVQQVPWFHLPPAMAWYYRQGRADYRPLPPFRPDCQAMMDDVGDAAISLISPAGADGIYIPVELDGRRGRIVFEAAHRDPGTAIYWHLDEDFVGVTRDIHHLSLSPVPGRHRITLVDAAGASIQRDFTILSDGR